MRNLLFASLLVLFSCAAFAATPQQEKMKACNADAAKQQLKGDARKQFMKTCLSAKKDNVEDKKAAAAEPAKDAPKATAQQQKMKTCNADAKAKNLSGQARKDFMKTCLSAG